MRTSALGITFDELDLDAACNVCAARAADAPFTYVVTPHAVHVVQVFRGDRRYIDGINGAGLVVCDSRVVSNLVALLFGRVISVAPGSDLTLRLLSSVILPRDVITVIGGDDALTARLRQTFGLQNLRVHVPPQGFAQDPSALKACVTFVCQNPSRFVFLACGAPQSELLGAEILQNGGATGLGLCIGASLLFATGLMRRAPVLMQRMSLEWLHRLMMEPRRMAQRLWASQLPLLWIVLRYRFAKDRTILPKHQAVAWNDK